MIDTAEDWMTRREVAGYLRVSQGTLANWATQRKGPKFVRLGGGKVLYNRAAVNDYLNSLQTAA
ncbi:helix-turn-helix transcriptional regulator [Nocardia flavorosea]|uniref:Helix-turn-helix domain-containing protein n=1 Tax=Nocardia flavorosea TaxID=53429 RepID=A0A846YNW5_9NOCA|nr:helix-turn-helix domain-containing protein [Nocardia flavorosea]NKY60805.1 helix-turn-helix domain-containing protein [Nocardia flavorosea]